MKKEERYKEKKLEVGLKVFERDLKKWMKKLVEGIYIYSKVLSLFFI